MKVRLQVFFRDFEAPGHEGGFDDFGDGGGDGDAEDNGEAGDLVAEDVEGDEDEGGDDEDDGLGGEVGALGHGDDAVAFDGDFAGRRKFPAKCNFVALQIRYTIFGVINDNTDTIFHIACRNFLQHFFVHALIQRFP